MEVEDLETASLEEPSELALPSGLADPPDKPCSDKTMVSLITALPRISLWLRPPVAATMSMGNAASVCSLAGESRKIARGHQAGQKC